MLSVYFLKQEKDRTSRRYLKPALLVKRIETGWRRARVNGAVRNEISPCDQAWSLIKSGVRRTLYGLAQEQLSLPLRLECLPFVHGSSQRDSQEYLHGSSGISSAFMRHNRGFLLACSEIHRDRGQGRRRLRGGA
jgi:hypothetical protein